MVDKPQSQATKPSLSISEAIERVSARRSAADPPAPQTQADAAPPDDQAHDDDGLKPDGTNLDAEESDAGEGQDGDDPGQDEQQEQDEDDPLYVVTIGGVEQEVPLSELLSSFSRHGDYTKKTQALASQRQEVESKAEKIARQEAELAEQVGVVTREKEQYDQALNSLQEVLKGTDDQWANVDWEKLQEEDPIEANRQFMAYQLHKERKAAVDAEMARRADERKAEATKRHKDAVSAFQQQIAKHFPQWADEATRTQDWSRMYKVAKGLGFTDAEIQGTTDARIFRLLHQAMRNDQKADARQRATSPAPARSGREPARVVSPSGARPATRAGSSASVRDAMDRFKTTRSIDDAAGAMAAARQASARSARR